MISRLPARRHAEILRRLEQDGCVRVTDLARALGVTDETIRRDLEVLSDDGRLQRTHGGATLRDDGPLNLPMPEREPLHRAEKLRIARRAAPLVTPRSTVFLDGSSTVFTLAGQLPDVDATVITNAGHVVAALADKEHVQVVCTGGDYERRSRSLVGPIAEEAVHRYHLEWLFVGVDGLDPEWGASEINQGQARLKERLCHVADRVCVLADSSKLGRKSAFLIATLDRIDLFITDRAAQPEMLEPYRASGLEIWLAD